MGLAEGGVVASPTVALIGEAGPEAVIPLNRANDFRGFGSQTVNVNLSISIGEVNSPADVAKVKDATLDALDEALWRRQR
jgi:hypothetical protein